MRTSWSFFIGLLIVFGCSSTFAQSKRIVRVMSPEMLGADLPYLEKITGPAWRTFENTKSYLIDGCIVEARLSGNAIQNLKMPISPKCTFDLNKFLGTSKKFVPLTAMTFGKFEDVVGRGRFLADCITICGNTADPSIYEYWSLPRAQNSLEV